MAKTLLNGVNDVLEKLGIIHGDTAVLTSLTDSARQRVINLAVDAWNETIVTLYSYSNKPMPEELGEGTITLVTSDRDYALASGFVRLHWPLKDETNGHEIHEYPGGYLQLVNDQPFPAQETGLPTFGAINPVNSELYLDKLPTATENGYVFKYRYDTEVLKTTAAATMPFNDTVYTALVPAVAQQVSKTYRRTFDAETYNESLGLASRSLSLTGPKTSYINQIPTVNPTDPFE